VLHCDNTAGADVVKKCMASYYATNIGIAWHAGTVEECARACMNHTPQVAGAGWCHPCPFTFVFHASMA
jgi:hypothetical protein